MLRIFDNTSASGAKSHNSSSDSYVRGTTGRQELSGEWRGLGAERPRPTAPSEFLNSLLGP